MSDDTTNAPIRDASAASDMADRAWVLAIDFGTSYTVAASRVGDARPEVIEIGGERRIPSIVLVTPNGEMHVGSAAENLGVSHPGRSVRRPKTRLGEPAPVILGGRAYVVGDLIAEILRDVYTDAVRHHGSEPSEVRLTHPATWNSPRRNQLRSAAVAAGMSEPVLVPEPVAAAISFIDDVDVGVGDRVLVYDLGGGTFDTAALESTVDGFVVIGRPGGDASIGGELFDELVAQAIGGELDPGAYEQLEVADDPDWVHANTTLRREARRAKEALSSQPYADVVVPLPTGIARVRITLERLEEILKPHLAATAEILRDTATAAGLDGTAISAIHLVGGASRTPLVEQLVRSEFPDVAISRRGDPKSAVALGATHPRATPTSLAQNSGARRAATIEQPGPPAEPRTEEDDTPPKTARPDPVVSPPAAPRTSPNPTDPTVTPGASPNPTDPTARPQAAASEPPPPTVRPKAVANEASAPTVLPKQEPDPPLRAAGDPRTRQQSEPPPGWRASAQQSAPSQPPPPQPKRPSQPPPPRPPSPSQPVSDSAPKSGRSARLVGVIVAFGLLVAGVVVAFIVTRPSETIVEPPATTEPSDGSETVFPIVDASGVLLTSNDLDPGDDLAEWGPRDLDPQFEEVTTMRIHNGFCEITSLESLRTVASYDAVQFERFGSDRNLEQLAHEVAIFASADGAIQWIDDAFVQFHSESCSGGGPSTAVRELDDGVTYDVSFTTLGFPFEFVQDECVGQMTNAVYRAVEQGNTDTSAVQIHRIRRCGRAVGIVTSRSVGELTPDEDEFVTGIDGVAVARLATFDDPADVVDGTDPVGNTDAADTTVPAVDDVVSVPVATHVPEGEQKFIGLSLEQDVAAIENPAHVLALAGHGRLIDEQGVTTTTNFFDPVELPRAELLRSQGGGTEFVTAVGFLYADEVATVAPEFPGTNFAVIDDAMLDADGTPRCANCVGVTFAEEQAAFLAGVAAALTSQTGRVGFLGGVSGIGLTERFEAGFSAGVMAVNSEFIVVVRYVTEAPDFDGFFEPARAQEVAREMYFDGVDVIYEAASTAGFGVFEAARARSASGRKVWAIGSDADRYPLADPTVQEFILTSTVKRIDNAVYLVANSHFNGEFEAGNMHLTLAEGAYSLSTAGGFTDGISGQLDEFTARIIDGSIVVPTVPDR